MASSLKLPIMQKAEIPCIIMKKINPHELMGSDSKNKINIQFSPKSIWRDLSKKSLGLSKKYLAMQYEKQKHLEKIQKYKKTVQ